MLRMELEAQQARALEWNGVHSWVTSLFQWCSKRRINPPNSRWKKKYNLRLVMETHTRQQAEDWDTGGWHTYSMPENLTTNQHRYSKQQKIHIKLPCHFKQLFLSHRLLYFTHSQDSAENRQRVALRTVTLSFVKFIFQGDIPYLRG